MVKKLLESISNEFLDALFPENLTCFNCGKELKQNEKFLCEFCKNDVDIIKHCCKICGNPINSQTEICDDCKNNKRTFDKAISPFEYSKTAQNLIYKLKYNKEKYIAKVFAKPLFDCFNKNNLEKIDIVTCIPLSKKRKKERRFNQAEVIAREFVKELNEEIKENYNLVERIKDTPTQTNLTKTQRHENLKNAFKLVCNKKEIKDKNILIVDDVFTTGATMDELSKILKRAKCGKIYCLTVCHTNLNRYKN